MKHTATANILTGEHIDPMSLFSMPVTTTPMNSILPTSSNTMLPPGVRAQYDLLRASNQLSVLNRMEPHTTQPTDSNYFAHLLAFSSQINPATFSSLPSTSLLSSDMDDVAPPPPKRAREEAGSTIQMPQPSTSMGSGETPKRPPSVLFLGVTTAPPKPSTSSTKPENREPTGDPIENTVTTLQTSIPSSGLFPTIHPGASFASLQNNFCMGGTECRTLIKLLQEDLFRTRTEKDNLLAKLKEERENKVYIYQRIQSKATVQPDGSSSLSSIHLFSAVLKVEEDVVVPVDNITIAKMAVEILKNATISSRSSPLSTSPLNISVNDKEIVVKSNKIKLGSLLVLNQGREDKNFFSITYRLSERTDKAKCMVFCTHTSFSAGEIVDSILRVCQKEGPKLGRELQLIRL